MQLLFSLVIWEAWGSLRKANLLLEPVIVGDFHATRKTTTYNSYRMAFFLKQLKKKSLWIFTLVNEKKFKIKDHSAIVSIFTELQRVFLPFGPDAKYPPPCGGHRITPQLRHVYNGRGNWKADPLRASVNSSHCWYACLRHKKKTILSSSDVIGSREQSSFIKET